MVGGGAEPAATLALSHCPFLNPWPLFISATSAMVICIQNHSEAAIRAYGDEERLSKEMPGARRHCIVPSIHRAASCSTQFALVASCRHDDSYVLTLPHDSRCMQMDKTLKAHSASWGCCSEVQPGESPYLKPTDPGTGMHDESQRAETLVGKPCTVPAGASEGARSPVFVAAL